MKSKNLRKVFAVTLAIALAVTMYTGIFAGETSLDGRCTQFYIGKDLTDTGAYLWGRTEDYDGYWAKVYTVVPAADHEPGDLYWSSDPESEDFCWPYPAHTLRYTTLREPIYQVDYEYIGPEPWIEASLNEKGVAVSATVTLSGYSNAIRSVDPWGGTEAIGEADIPSVVAMQAETARQGCEIIAEVINAVGANGAEGFMVSDPKEVWYFQTLSGHQYVAVKCPSDMVGFSPNLTGNVDVSDTANVITSPELVQVAQNAGTLVLDGKGNIKVADSYARAVSATTLTRMWLGTNYLRGTDAANAIEANLNNSGTGGRFIDFFAQPRTTGKYTLYEALRLLAYRGDGTVKDVDAPTGAPTDRRAIGHVGTTEAHVFEVRPDMPTELATIKWLSMAPPEFSVYVPFYASLITEVYSKYDLYDDAFGYNGADPDDNTFYWVCRELYREIIGSANYSSDPRNKANRLKYGKGVQDFWERYQKSLIAQQAQIDVTMAKILKNEGVAAAEAAATMISLKISEETFNYANMMLTELKAFKASGAPGDFVPSVLLDKDALPNYANILIDSAVPSASVEKLSGNKNSLTVTVTETYADGSKKNAVKTFSIDNNAAGTYEVGGYSVYVDTKGNTQVRDCRIVK